MPVPFREASSGHDSARRRRGAQMLSFCAGAATCLLALHTLATPLPALPSGGAALLPPARWRRGFLSLYSDSGPSPPVFEGLEGVRGSKLLFVSFANKAFFDFLHNWSKSVARLGLPHFVAAFDEETAALCEGAGIPHGLLTAGSVGAASYRGNLTLFRAMGSLKVRLVTSLLEDYGVETLVVSDTDTVWMKDPTPYLDDHPIADIFISTDCLSHKLEATQAKRHNQPRCGHIAENYWGRALNSGIFVLRNRPATLGMLRRWQLFMTDPAHAILQWGNDRQSVVTDQLALNMVLTEGNDQHSHAVPGERGTIWLARNNSVRGHALPVALFPGGHVGFVQRVPWRIGVEPYVIHATFQQRFPFRVQPPAKVNRFREFGMWLLDPPPFYEGRFLAYDNDVLEFVDRVATARHGGRMPAFYKHWLGVSYQQALFHEALAVAGMTNRTAVLPQSWCWCDYDHVPHVMETCRMRGSDLTLPFECPADYVFNTPLLAWQPGLRFRMPNFLELPWVPEAVRTSRAAVQVLPTEGAPLPAGVAAPQATAWLGMDEQPLLARLAPMQGAAILELRGLRPGLVHGFADRAAAHAFDARWLNITRDNNWCCAGERMGMDRISFPFAAARPFAEPWRPYEPPVLPVPWYCAAKNVTQENLQYIAYANHPCQFLTNTTAFAIASELESRQLF